MIWVWQVGTWRLATSLPLKKNLFEWEVSRNVNIAWDQEKETRKRPKKHGMYYQNNKFGKSLCVAAQTRPWQGILFFINLDPEKETQGSAQPGRVRLQVSRGPVLRQFHCWILRNTYIGHVYYSISNCTYYQVNVV